VTLTAAQLDGWLSIPPHELAAHARIPFTLVDTPEDVHRTFAATQFAEFADARAAGERIAVIVPVGPTGHFAHLARMVNEARLGLDHVTFFAMDEWLDWEGRPLPDDHPLRLEGIFRRDLLGRIDAELRPRDEDVIFPSPLALDRCAEEIERRGGISTCYAGVGFQGHLAFNEPPATRWSPVTVEQLARSRTRVVPIAVDTAIAHAQRSAGGNVFAVPPMGITLGMRELLGAKRLRMYIDTGAWKQTMLRILLFSEPDVAYPATLASLHPDAEVVADLVTATVPERAIVGDG
jgi:glucosamine-6-phosphate deaminase